MFRRTIFCLCLFAPAPALGAGEPPWKAGAARVNITPTHPMWMSGYSSRTKPAEGKLTELWAKALALQDPTGRCAVLVTMDLVGINRELSVSVCAQLQKRFRLPRAGILLAVSHTHSGPVVGGNLAPMYFLDAPQKELVRAYAQTLQEKVLQVVGEALGALAPAELSWQTGRATFAVNRRNNKEEDVPRLRALGRLRGPVDHDVPVLAVRDQGGILRAVVFGYACHATVLPFYEWSGDYPGFAQGALERAHPETVALFWAGCGGDQNPLPRRSVARAEAYGRELAGSVEAVLRAPMHPIRGTLATAYAEIDLPFAPLPSRDQLAAQTLGSDRYVAQRARLLLEQVRKDGRLHGTYPYPVQAWRLGPELVWVALGGEVVVDYALRLKQELGPARTWICAYANDVMAYVPSVRVLLEGGYEGGGAMVYYGQPAPWSPRVEGLIVAGVHDQVRRVRGGAVQPRGAPPP